MHGPQKEKSFFVFLFIENADTKGPDAERLIRVCVRTVLAGSPLASNRITGLYQWTEDALIILQGYTGWFGYSTFADDERALFGWSRMKGNTYKNREYFDGTLIVRWLITNFNVSLANDPLRKHGWSNILKNLQPKQIDISHIPAQNIDCGFSLEPPRRVPTIYVFKQNKKNNVYPCKSQVYNIKVGFKGVNII